MTLVTLCRFCKVPTLLRSNVCAFSCAKCITWLQYDRQSLWCRTVCSPHFTLSYQVYGSFLCVNIFAPFQIITRLFIALILHFVKKREKLFFIYSYASAFEKGENLVSGIKPSWFIMKWYSSTRLNDWGRQRQYVTGVFSLGISYREPNSKQYIYIYMYRSSFNALITATSMHGSQSCYSDVQLLLQCFWVRFESLFPVVSFLHVYSWSY